MISKVACVALAAVVVACSSDEDADDASEFISRYCELSAPCCEKVGKKFDGLKCRQFFTLFTVEADYDAEKGEACLAAARDEPDLCAGLSDATDELCEGVFKTSQSSGTKQPGEPCESDSDCAASAEGEVRCDYRSDGTTTTRKCRLDVRAKEGDACVGDKEGDSTFTVNAEPNEGRVNVCWDEDGLYCDDKKCTKRKAPGEACDSSRSCVTGARCVSGGTGRACAALKAKGEACTPSTSSFEGPCMDKLYCDSGSNTCAPVLADGAPCTNNAQCGPGGCVNGACSGSGGSSSLFCTE